MSKKMFEANEKQRTGIKELAEGIVLEEARLEKMKKDITAKGQEGFSNGHNSLIH